MAQWLHISACVRSWQDPHQPCHVFRELAALGSAVAAQGRQRAGGVQGPPEAASRFTWGLAAISHSILRALLALEDRESQQGHAVQPGLGDGQLAGALAWPLALVRALPATLQLVPTPEKCLTRRESEAVCNFLGHVAAQINAQQGSNGAAYAAAAQNNAQQCSNGAAYAAAAEEMRALVPPLLRALVWAIGRSPLPGELLEVLNGWLTGCGLSLLGGNQPNDMVDKPAGQANLLAAVVQLASQHGAGMPTQLPTHRAGQDGFSPGPWAHLLAMLSAVLRTDWCFGDAAAAALSEECRGGRLGSRLSSQLLALLTGMAQMGPPAQTGMAGAAASMQGDYGSPARQAAARWQNDVLECWEFAGGLVTRAEL